jgi:hypothetical protein
MAPATRAAVGRHAPSGAELATRGARRFASLVAAAAARNSPRGLGPRLYRTMITRLMFLKVTRSFGAGGSAEVSRGDATPKGASGEEDGGDDAAHHARLLSFATSLSVESLVNADDSLPEAVRDAMRTAYLLGAGALGPQRRPVDGTMAGQPMPCLYTDGFDTEQIWMQIDLLAAAVYKAGRCGEHAALLIAPRCTTCAGLSGVSARGKAELWPGQAVVFSHDTLDATLQAIGATCGPLLGVASRPRRLLQGGSIAEHGKVPDTLCAVQACTAWCA